MSNCQCSDTITTTPCVDIPALTGCSNIRMFFGEYVKEGSETAGFPRVPGQLSKLYYTQSIDTDYIQKGFKINNYDAQELVDSGILPDGFGKTVSSSPTNTFDLTEIELLASATWEGWIIWLSGELSSIRKADLVSTSDNRSFGFYCLKALDFDLEYMQANAIVAFQALQNGDPSGIYSKVQPNITNAPKTNTNQNSRGSYYKTTSELTSKDCAELRIAEDVERLILCHEWLQKIHDTYYGKQFLVKIGDAVPPSGSAVTYPLNTLCIKDNNGFYPNLTYPYFIEGDGSAQGYNLSDEIDNTGGFPNKDDTEILGLKDLDWVVTENGKVGSFVKIGPYGTKSKTCDNIYDQKIYYKFHKDSSSCIEWKIDLSKLNPESFYLSLDNNDTQYLYMSCSVSEKFYVDANGTWAHVTLNDSVPLIPIGESGAQGFVLFDILLFLAPIFKTATENSVFLPLIKNPFGSGFSFSLFTWFYKLSPYLSTIFGAKNNTNLLNLAQSNRICLTPEAVAIPFKSNLYQYGPFYYGDGDPGGVDVINDEDIVPWNFIKNGQYYIPVSYTYNDMEKFGSDMASAGPRELQKLEKGRITVAGLPCYCLAHFVDNKDCYNPNELGPTLLTDMSAEYGAGGFNTTYNFSTYSPKFGKPEKYLIDAWKDNIKDNQYRNKYLKSIEKQAYTNSQSYKLRLINGERSAAAIFPEKNVYAYPKLTKDSTTNSLMFSGYYLQVNPTISSDYAGYGAYETYVPLSSTYPPDKYCDICSTTSTMFTPIPTPNLEYPISSGLRLYAFAETDKAYSSEYIQNTYYQLAGMSLDGFFLPVSLRGVNQNPNVKEYIKYSDSGTRPNQFELFSGNKLHRNPSWQNQARLPRFARRCENNGSFIEWDALSTGGTWDRTKSNNPGYPIPSKTRDEIPPFILSTQIGSEHCYALQINQRYLNPMLSEKNLLGTSVIDEDAIDGWDSRKNNSNKGFVISSIIFGQDHIDYQMTHTSVDNSVSAVNTDYDKYTDEFIRQQFRNFRFPALRGPLVLQGWGYDTTGKPIPNSADGWGHAQMGEFRKDSLTDKFMKNWLQNPKTWPVGPVDLRFDRERGVWTCPSPNKIVVARLKERLFAHSKAKAELINPSAGGIRFYENYTISGPNGENVKLNMSNTEITVYDFLGVELCECDIVYAYYDDNRYIILESNRAYKDPNEQCDLCTTTTTTTTTATTTTPSCWCGLECLQSLADYDPLVEQILGHDSSGCLKWFDVTDCSS